MEWEPPLPPEPLEYFYYVRQVNSTRLFPVFFGEQPVSAGVAFPVGRLDLSFLLETVIRIFDSVGDYTEFIGQATVRNWWNLLAPLNTKAVSPGIVIPIMKMGRWNGHQSILSLSWESLLYTGNTTPHPHPHECQQYFYFIFWRVGGGGGGGGGGGRMNMKKSSTGNMFRLTGPLSGNPPVDPPPQRPVMRNFDAKLWSPP